MISEARNGDDMEREHKSRATADAKNGATQADANVVPSTGPRDLSESVGPGRFNGIKRERAEAGQRIHRALAREQGHTKRTQDQNDRGVEVDDPKDDEIGMLSVDPESIEQARNRLCERVEHGQQRVWLALARFEELVRDRDLSGALKGGFTHTAQKRVTDWFTDKLKSGLTAVLKTGELPIATATKGVSIAREALEGQTKAEKTRVHLDAMSQLTSSTRQVCVAISTAALTAIRSAIPNDVFQADRAAEQRGELISEADVGELVKQLDATLFEAERSSGTMTVNETLDSFQHMRKHETAEIDAASKRQPE